MTEAPPIEPLWQRLRWLLDPLPIVHAPSGDRTAALSRCPGAEQVLPLDGDPADPASYAAAHEAHGDCNLVITGVLDQIAPEQAAQLITGFEQLIGQTGVLALQVPKCWCASRTAMHMLLPDERFRMFGEGHEDKGGHATYWVMARRGSLGEEFTSKGQRNSATNRITDGAGYWDDQAEAYATGRRPSDVDQATLQAVAPRGAVLELGAGPGVFTRQARVLHTGRYVATDISPKFCAMLRELDDITVLESAHTELAFDAKSFDTIYAMATLHHLDPEACIRVLHRAWTWLRPGGSLALVEDWAFTPSTPTEEHLVALRSALRQAVDPGEAHPTEDEWVERLEAAGLMAREIRQAPRREDLTRYEALEDPDSQRRLAWLRTHDPAPTVPMSILIAEAAR